jgi:uncharacterized membrane protein
LLILVCIALNGAGFIWKLFEPIPLYDEIAHFLTPFVLVAVLAEIIYRGGGDDEFFDSRRHAIVTGSVIGLLGAGGWEVVEILLAFVGAAIYNALPDTMFDVVLGVLGGAAGAYVADHFLDRIFNRSRTDSNRPTVR